MILYILLFINASFALFKPVHEIKTTSVLFVMLVLNKRLFAKK